MVQPITYRFQQSQFQAFDEAIARGREAARMPGMTDQDKARHARDVECVVGNALQIPVSLRGLWNSTLDLIAESSIEDYKETGDQLRGSFANGLRVLEGVRDLVQTCRNAGILIRNDAKLLDALSETRRLEREIFDRWPEMDEKDVAEAHAEYARGEFQDMDEAFAEIAGVDLETWRGRVEARRRELQEPSQS